MLVLRPGSSTRWAGTAEQVASRAWTPTFSPEHQHRTQGSEPSLLSGKQKLLFLALSDRQGAHVLQGTRVPHLSYCLFLPQPCPKSWTEFGILLPCTVQNMSRETTAWMNKTETVRKRNKNRRRGNNLNGMREFVIELAQEDPNIEPTSLEWSVTHWLHHTAQVLFVFRKIPVSRSYC